MDKDAIQTWIDRAKTQEAQPAAETKAASGCIVIRAEKKSHGNLIMELSEMIRPWIAEMFRDVRDENGMLVQPGRVRAISLTVAQDLVKQDEMKASA